MEIYDKKDFYKKFRPTWYNNNWSEEVIKAGYKTVVMNTATVFLFERKLSRNGVIYRVTPYVSQPPLEYYSLKDNQFKKEVIKSFRF